MNILYTLMLSLVANFIYDVIKQMVEARPKG